MALQYPMADAMRLIRAGNLGEATSLLRTSLGGVTPSPAPAPAPASGGVIDLVPERVTTKTARPGRMTEHRHNGAGAAVDYLLYRPADAGPAMPLVVMLHGCTQTPEDFARGTGMNRVADEHGFLVAYPRQPASANPQKCWNWFRPGDQKRGGGEPALIAGVAGDLVAAGDADPRRIYVAGLSAGGAAAAVLADAYPDVFAAVGVHSGLACGIARDVPSALAAMRSGPGPAAARHGGGGRFVPLITFHGDRDGTVAEANARAIVREAAAAAGVPVTVAVESGEAGGRRYTRALSRNAGGDVLIEQWTVAGAGHAWSGGDPAGSYADAAGPDASQAMARFFLANPMRG